MKLFDFASSETTLAREIRGGVITFMTMAYIIFVQPAMLSHAGMDFGAITFATCISAAVATMMMGLYANLPIALAPGMGENAFFTFTVVLGMGMVWQSALGAVFIAGIIFLLLSILKVRRAILNAIPDTMRYATAGGIGLFIAFLGLIQGGLVTKSEGGVLQIGNLHSPVALIAILGLIVMMILYIKKVPGAIFFGIVISAIVAFAVGLIKYEGILSLPPDYKPTFLKFAFHDIGRPSFWLAVFIFLYMDLFDTIGTLLAVAYAGNLVTPDGEVKNVKRAMVTDATGTVVGAMFGTSTVTSYIESTTGIAAGARTGFAAVIVALLFIISMFFYPIIKAIGGGITVGGTKFYPITAPALIMVGILMAKTIKEIEWEKFWLAIPAFLTLIGIPLTFSIADGMALGFIAYPICAVAAGKGEKVSTTMWIIAGAFVLRYVLFKG